jgi:N-acyl-phosphatidylethanolamine-hydrolysing phospholipase D
MKSIYLQRAASVMGLTCILTCLQGCVFARISSRNVPAFFRAPTAVHKLDRRDVPAGTRLSATWIGHSTVLLQMDDKFLLTDPILTQRIGVVSKRLVEPGMDLDSIPPLALVLVSHRHFDHLSPESLKLLGPRVKDVVVPPGEAGDLKSKPYHVHELPLWQETEFEGVSITAVPAIHNGGRSIRDEASHPHAYTGYIVNYHGLTVYFPGDTAFGEEVFASVRQRFGPVDLALLPIGPISPPSLMQKTHMDPTQAVSAAAMLEASVMLPVHFETFVNSLDTKTQDREALEIADRSVPHPRTRVLAWHIGQSVVVR